MTPSSLQASIKLGAFNIEVLSDGIGQREFQPFFGQTSPAEWLPLVGASDARMLLPINFGAFLVRRPGRLTLIDTGLGARGRELAAHGGELLFRLRDVGVAVGDIDEIVHTHLHTDHCGWNVNDDEAGALTFPRAAVIVSQAEYTYWMGSQADADQRTPYIRSRVLPVETAGLLRTVIGEVEVSPGITLIPTPGHTPGHCSVLISSEGQHLLVLGDAAHHPAHLEHHDWIPSFDVDPAASRRSRSLVSELASDLGALVTGGHFMILTLGRLVRTDGAYKWEDR